MRILSSSSIRGPANGQQAMEEQAETDMEEQKAEGMGELALEGHREAQKACPEALMASSYFR